MGKTPEERGKLHSLCANQNPTYTHYVSGFSYPFAKKRSILMLGKEVVFSCRPSVLVVRDLQKEYD